MEEQTEIVEIKHKNMYVPICITQTVCIAAILIAVLIIKFFFKGSFEKLQNWYCENILDETKLTQVFDEENLGED